MRGFDLSAMFATEAFTVWIHIERNCERNTTSQDYHRHRTTGGHIRTGTASSSRLFDA